MPLIDKEKELLYKIVCEEDRKTIKENFFATIDMDSYYMDSMQTEDEYLQEYDFETPTELKEMLEKIFIEKELPMDLLTPLIVMIFKLKGNINKKEILMETIYNF